ncbi:MAG: hypothetical protein HOJ22_03440 [Chloroflexi bacterium]|nr:hypothetical protein [Chloroflexota bacterium]MBT5627321.1 hypothetical protein [Chloroflexota bacterium]
MSSIVQIRSAFANKPSLVMLGLTLLLAVVAACGASEAPAVEDAGSVDEEGLRLTTRPEANYSIDDLVAVGFKKNRQFGPETVPGSLDVWYGFFAQRDIEVRFYESHADAIEFGVEPAELIIARTAGQRDPLIPVVNLYPAYAVVGNTVMLCERQLSTCEALIEALP